MTLNGQNSNIRDIIYSVRKLIEKQIQNEVKEKKMRDNCTDRSMDNNQRL